MDSLYSTRLLFGGSFVPFLEELPGDFLRVLGFQDRPPRDEKTRPIFLGRRGGGDALLVVRSRPRLADARSDDREILAALFADAGRFIHGADDAVGARVPRER